MNRQMREALEYECYEVLKLGHPPTPEKCSKCLIYGSCDTEALYRTSPAETVLYEITIGHGMVLLRSKLTGEIIGKEKLSQIGSWIYRDARKWEKFYEI